MRNHGLTFQVEREIASPNTCCCTKIDGLISKRLAEQVPSAAGLHCLPNNKRRGLIPNDV